MTLALIAGEGALPRLLYDVLDPSPYVAALEGFPPENIPHHRTFRIEQLGSFIGDLKERGVTEVCFAGAVRRPPLDPSAVDAATMPLLPAMMQALQQGDDAALRTVLSFFEGAGLTVRAAHELRSDLLLSAGIPTARQPSGQAEADAARAAIVVNAMGAADVGQGCIVCNGQVLAMEAVMGTDWMVSNVAFFRAADLQAVLPGTALRFLPDGETFADAMGFPDALRKGGVLYKAPKPNQDMRIDVPTIGVQSVRAAAAAGLEGIVIVAGGVMVIDLKATLAEADKQGLFLWIREP